ncbi:hypothetical protein [Paenibacillus dakarensis]|uniref:hypothetical protein n=1 Tax=Paenibacillus dakarensis TaxID=1527293 RepID=UPI0006D53ED8|nr:hypothetical protein [Paenibacillus dakarensis]
MPRLETDTANTYPSREASSRKGPRARWFWMFWILFILLGVAAAYSYSNHLQKEIITKLQQDTQKEMASLKAQYDSRFTELSRQMDEMQSKVQSFNELLTFTKDQASGKTDNSNKLYSQLNEVKQQLTKLQKKMELLK